MYYSAAIQFIHIFHITYVACVLIVDDLFMFGRYVSVLNVRISTSVRTCVQMKNQGDDFYNMCASVCGHTYMCVCR